MATKRIVTKVIITKTRNVYGEWVCMAYDQDGKRFGECDYYTHDRADAERTAVRMVDRQWYRIEE